jgi:hypothetical protein
MGAQMSGRVGGLALEESAEWLEWDRRRDSKGAKVGWSDG